MSLLAVGLTSVALPSQAATSAMVVIECPEEIEDLILSPSRLDGSVAAGEAIQFRNQTGADLEVTEGVGLGDVLLPIGLPEGETTDVVVVSSGNLVIESETCDEGTSTIFAWTVRNPLCPAPSEPSGNGLSTPYEIATSANLQWMLNLTSVQRSQNFRLMRDIDMNGCVWEYNLKNFNGTFDGQGHVISNLMIEMAVNDAGLFGSLLDDAVIENLGFQGTVKGLSEVGGLVGQAYGGAIRNSFFIGDVEGVTRVGGLVGSNEASIDRSYSAGGTITATGNENIYLGGLVGANFSEITDAYTTNSVISTGSETSCIGGFVGSTLFGTITDSYSTGTPAVADYKKFFQCVTGGFSGDEVGDVFTSFYSGLPVVAQGEPKTTIEMQDILTYTTAPANWSIAEGWNEEVAPNTIATWGICPLANEGLPFLNWQFTSDPCTPLSSSPPVPGRGPTLQVIEPAPIVSVAPTRKAVSEFAGFSSRLTPQMRREVRRIVRQNPEAQSVQCRGYVRISTKPIRSDIALANARARAVCNQIKMLNPNVKTQILKSRATMKKRRVEVTFRS